MNTIITDLTKFSEECHKKAAYMNSRPVIQGERNLIQTQSAEDVWKEVAKELELIVAKCLIKNDLVNKDNGILRADMPVPRQINTLLRNSEIHIRNSIRQTLHAAV